jgi:hypothetical protein
MRYGWLDASWGAVTAVGEAVVGKFLLALFVFTLGRKVER